MEIFDESVEIHHNSIETHISDHSHRILINGSGKLFFTELNKTSIINIDKYYLFLVNDTTSSSHNIFRFRKNLFKNWC